MRNSLFIALLLVVLGYNSVASQLDYTKYVMPIVGTQSEFILSNGNVLPFVARPWGMNHWTPQTAPNGEPWQYTYNSYFIVALKQTHQPSPWGGDYAMFSLMPTVGEKVFLEKDRQSWFSHKTETSKPHYYSVFLADHNVKAEMTSTNRGCVMRFTFPKSNKSNVVIDAFDKASYIKVIPEQNKVIGYTTQYYHNGKRAPENFKNYFVITFSKPFIDFSVWKDDGFSKGISEVTAKRSGAVVSFHTQEKEMVEARIASSFIGFEQAEINLKREIGNMSFEDIVDQGKKEWNSYLSLFHVEDNHIDDLDKVRMFYTALYRMFIYPREFFEYDANGSIVHYSPFNGEVLPGRMYTDNGYWDTFRAARPFFDLFFPEWSSHYMEGIVNTYKESGWLPEWVSPGHVDAMIGSNSASVITCAYLNGVKNIDIEILWEAMLKMADNAHPTLKSVGRDGIEYYKKLGYIPNDVGVRESAAKTLEYAYADYCVYSLAKALKKEQSIIDKFKARSQYYKNLFCKEHNLMVGRDSNGKFKENFNPFAWGGEFTEGNSLHYSWSVFQDPKGLAQLMGGEADFINMLDTIFKMPSKFDVSAYNGQVIHEVREMHIMDFGQYAHGNQPIQHMIYLYNWTNQPWKSQYWAKEAMKRLYRPTPDGYCGDEDNGQTSAWYVFSALGFYPVNPVSGEYALGSPLFRKMVITLPGNKKLVINAPANSDDNAYIKSLKVNNKIHNKNYLIREQIQNGGHFIFEMSNQPEKNRGTKPGERPYSMSDNQ